METTFQIKAKNPHNCGDGMAIWFTDSKFKPGQAFGAAEQFKGLGIFFDLFPNGNSGKHFPYISAMINDGTKTYDHARDGEGNLLAGCSAKIINTDMPIHAKIIYHNNNLELLLFLNHESGWSPCFKVQNVSLQTSGYIGVSALTGDATGNSKMSP